MRERERERESEVDWEREGKRERERHRECVQLRVSDKKKWRKKDRERGSVRRVE